MKKTLFMLYAVLALASCSKDEALTAGQDAEGRYIFNIGIQEPDYAPQSRAAVTMGRYLLEMYEGDLTAEPVKMTNTTGTFNVELKKGMDYVCLFWADNGTDYDATSLKAVKQADQTKPATAAYCAKVTVNSKTFNGAITLKRAVAELSFINKNELTEATYSLRITYPYAFATLNVGDGTVAYTPGTAERTINNIAPPTDKTQTFATDYILAPTTADKLDGLKLQLNAEPEKTIAQTAIQANFKTKITGEYERPMPSMRFTIDTRKNTNNTSDATFILPLKTTLNGYSLKVDWGDGCESIFANGTKLIETNMTHTYTSAGPYTITIYSSQRDFAKTQIPAISFRFNHTANGNALKIISLDTPLLNMGIDNLNFCFSTCANLISISATLLEKNPLATTFAYCFSECKSLTSIPATLFKHTPLAADFSNCFLDCNGLIGEIPAELFENNPAATTFFWCFKNCTGLTSIGEGLFAKNKAATNFSYCFAGCSNLALNANIFCNEATEASTRFKGQSINFTNCFANCGTLLSNGGVAPALWTYSMTVIQYSACFRGAKVTNNIPDDWK